MSLYFILQLATFLRYGLIIIFYGVAQQYTISFFNDSVLLVALAIFSISNGYMSSCMFDLKNNKSFFCAATW
jgi:hypothetical protein